jgi:hypothetical protein
MESFSESAAFHRLHDLLWTLGEPEVVELLTDEEKSALAAFNRVFASLPWRVIESHPQISELPDDDLSLLVPVGERLLGLLEARRQPPRQVGWLGKVLGRFGW